MEESNPSYTVGGKVNWLQPLWRTVERFLKKLKTELPYDPIIPLPGTHWEKTIIQKMHAAQRSLQHGLQQPGHGSNLNVHQQRSR